MKNTFVKVLSFLMALTMIVGTLGTVVVFAADCTHENATAGEVVAPKCNAAGFTWYTCDDCGASFKGDITPATGKHVEVDFYYPGTSASATCTSYGYIAGKQCAECGDGKTPLPGKEPKPNNNAKPLLHNFADGTYVEKTYCDEDSYVVYNCTRCGLSAEKCEEEDLKNGVNNEFAPKGKTYKDFERKVIVPGVAHVWGPFSVVGAPETACDETTVVRACTKCPKTETVVTKDTHNYVPVDYTSLKNYCGEFVYWEECTKCGDVRNQIANTGAGTNHKLVELTQVPSAANGATEEQILAFTKFNAAHNNSYTTNDKLSKPATCAQAGWQVYVCEFCGAYSVTVKGKQAHTYEGGYMVVDPTNNHGANDAGKACTTAKTLNQKCLWYDDDESGDHAGCGKSVVVATITAAVPHNYTVDANADGKPDGVTVHAPTCTDNGFTTYECQNPDCNATYNDNYVAATGHTLGDYYYCNSTTDTTAVTGALTCTNGIYRVKACTVEGCGYTTTVETLCAPTTHVESQSKVKEKAATCVKGAYKYYACANSDLCTIEGTKVEGSQSETLNPNNHADDQQTELVAKRVAATCTTAQVSTYVCSGCGKDYAKSVGNPLGHNMVRGGYWKGPDGKNGTAAEKKDDVNFAYVEPTCLTTGKTAGELCTVCGVVKTPQQVLPKNPANHKVKGVPVTVAGNAGEKKATHLGYTEATCLTPAYDTYRFDACCDAVEIVYVDGSTTVGCTYDEYDNTAPTCTEDGYHAYKQCKVCKTVVMTDFTYDCKYHSAEQHEILRNKGMWTLADVKIPALGHDFSVPVEAKPGVCVVKAWDANNKATEVEYENGYTAHFACSRCDVESEYSIVRAHARTEKTYDAKAADCVNAEFIAGTYCSVCVNIEGTEDYKKAHSGDPAKGHNYANSIQTVNSEYYVFVNIDNKLGETYTVKRVGGEPISATILKVKDCTKPAYILRICTADKCGEINMLPGSYVEAKGAHEWKYEATNHPVITLDPDHATGYTYACWGSSYTSKDCVNCDAISDAVYANDQIKHFYYVEGVLKEIDTSCGAIAKYDGVVCALCKLEVIASNDALEEYSANGYIGADHNYVKDSKPATCTEMGYSTTYCTDCKKEQGKMTTILPYNPTLNPYTKAGAIDTEIVKAVLENRPATATADGYIKYICAKCGETHTYTLKATGLNDLEVSVVPSASKVAAGNELTFVVKVKANKDVTFNSIKVNFNLGTLFEIDANNTNNALNYTFEGANVRYDFGTDFVNIYTEHNTEGKPVNTVIKAGDTVDFITFTVVADESINATTESAKLTATFSNGVKYKADGKTTEAVAPSVKQVTENKVKVYAVADVNGDGIVAGVSDIQALIAVYGTFEYDAVADINRDGVVNGNDITALRKFSVITAPKAIDYIEMIGQDLDAAIASAKVPNMNNDGIVDVNDEILFADAIIARLSTMDYKDYDYSTVEECVAALAKSIINAK